MTEPCKTCSLKLRSKCAAGVPLPAASPCPSYHAFSWLGSESAPKLFLQTSLENFKQRIRKQQAAQYSRRN